MFFFKLSSANFSPISLDASQVRPVDKVSLMERSNVEQVNNVFEVVSSIICA
jgi:hypothetical protein